MYPSPSLSSTDSCISQAAASHWSIFISMSLQVSEMDLFWDLQGLKLKLELGDDSGFVSSGSRGFTQDCAGLVCMSGLLGNKTKGRCGLTFTILFLYLGLQRFEARRPLFWLWLETGEQLNSGRTLSARTASRTASWICWASILFPVKNIYTRMSHTLYFCPVRPQHNIFCLFNYLGHLFPSKSLQDHLVQTCRAPSRTSPPSGQSGERSTKVSWRMANHFLHPLSPRSEMLLWGRADSHQWGTWNYPDLWASP